MSNEKEMKSGFVTEPGIVTENKFEGLLEKVEAGDVQASKSIYKAGEDFTPGGFDDLIGENGLVPTNSDEVVQQEGSIEVKFTEEASNPLYWEGQGVKTFPIPSTKSLLSPLEKGLEGVKGIPPFPMHRTDPDGGAEHLGRKVSYIPDYETFEDEFVVSEEFAEESEREEKNFVVFREAMECVSELARFIRIKQAIIEKDVRIFDKMSRRRKKVYISRLAYYEASTGKYTTSKHKSHQGFKLRPARLRYTEPHGDTFEALFNQWSELV